MLNTERDFDGIGLVTWHIRLRSDGIDQSNTKGVSGMENDNKNGEIPGGYSVTKTTSVLLNVNSVNRYILRIIIQ